MSANFHFHEGKLIKDIVSLRNGEIKLGEKFVIATKETFKEILENQTIKFVLFGISEDIGVKANFGSLGTSDMYESFLKSFLNIQFNGFNNFTHLAILGHFQYKAFHEEAHTLNPKVPKDRLRLFEMVQQIDQDVSKLCFKIIQHNKTPIIIGGGHNNCYGIIKGISLALKKPINVFNIDTHSDFRILEGRHSGNGFSYARNDGFLNKYFIYGLHENYTSMEVLTKLNKTPNVDITTFEEVYIREQKSFNEVIYQLKLFFGQKNFGIEIDLDALPNVMSSAFTPEGIPLKDVRKLIYQLQSTYKPLYLHVCEGIPNKNLPMHTEKTISYLVSDFIKNIKKQKEN